MWEGVSEKGGEVGEEHVRRANEKVLSKAKREELKEGDLVVKMFMRKRSGLATRYEGHYQVKAFDKDQGGYNLEDMEGKLLKDPVPIKQLKWVNAVIEEHEVVYEIEKVVSHWGKGALAVYEVKWKGVEKTTWEPVKYFKESLDFLRVYWKEFKRRKGRPSG